MKKTLLASFLLCSFSLNVYALQEPLTSDLDSRIKKVSYDEDDVVKVDSVIGVTTHLILDPDEKYVTYAFGDSDGWSFAHKANHYFVKPKETDSDTNLVIVTDKRTYNFDIRYHDTPYLKTDKKGHKSSGQVSFDRQFTFQIKFTYPEIEAAKEKAKREKEKLERQKNDVRTHGFNIDYAMNGSREIAPINVWDDGTFTYMKFAAGQDIPVVFYVDADDQESIVGQHSAGPNKEILVMHRTGKKWYLRMGKQVTGVYNNKLNNIENPNNTTSLRVVREVNE